MLYFRGCTAREKDSNIEEATKFILDKAGIKYHTIDNELCCGSILLRSGFYDEAIEEMRQNYDTIKDEDLILTSCAGCYKTLNEDYKEILGYDLNVIHISQLLYRLIKDGNIEVNDNLKDLKVTYHDPCHLGRASNVYEEPRDVIKKYSTLLEMENNREDALCCGSGGGVKSAFPEISANISRNRIKQAEETGCDLIVTACPFCKLNLNSNSDNLKVIDLCEFVEKALKNEDI